MSIFSRTKSKTRRGHSRPTDEQLEAKQERVERKTAWDLFSKQLKEDPELKRAFILKKMGVEAKPKDPSEQKRQEIRNKLVDEAWNLVESDEDLRKEYAESVIGEIVTVVGKTRHRKTGDIEGYETPGSSFASLLDEIDTIDELKTRLGAGGGGGGGLGGFLQGIALKDILGALPTIAALMGKSPSTAETGVVQSQRTYVVRINGQDKEVPESVYRRMLEQGEIVPVAGLVETAPQKEEQVTEREPTSQVGEEQQTGANLSAVLDSMDPEEITARLDLSPEEFVIELKDEADGGVDVSMLLWGFFGTANYDKVIEYLAPYKDSEKWSKIVERIMSEEGKLWMEQVLELVKGTEDGR